MNGFCINILDTPGHQDFSEDAYRTLMAADSAVMVIDGQPRASRRRRLSCSRFVLLRHIPIFTFINKLDREAKRSVSNCLDDIEEVCSVSDTCPVNWPIGSGKNFKGVYERDLGAIHHVRSGRRRSA